MNSPYYFIDFHLYNQESNFNHNHNYDLIYIIVFFHAKYHLYFNFTIENSHFRNIYLEKMFLISYFRDSNIIYYFIFKNFKFLYWS